MLIVLNMGLVYSPTLISKLAFRGLSNFVPQRSGSLRSEIEEANAQFMTIFKQQDAAALSELYVSDCKLLPTGCDVVEGKAGE